MFDIASGFNTFRSIDYLVYGILSKLINENEDIWKLLKYDTSDALSKPALTKQEKSEMIYKGIGTQNDFRVFRSPFVEDMVNDEQTNMRIYIGNVVPTNRSVGIVDIVFEFVTHNKIITLDGYINRLEHLIQSTIETLNGSDVGGSSLLTFDRNNNLSNSARLNLYNNRSYIGFSMGMSVHVGDIEKTC